MFTRSERLKNKQQYNLFVEFQFLFYLLTKFCLELKILKKKLSKIYSSSPYSSSFWQISFNMFSVSWTSFTVSKIMLDSLSHYCDIRLFKSSCSSQTSLPTSKTTHSYCNFQSSIPHKLLERIQNAAENVTRSQFVPPRIQVTISNVPWWSKLVYRNHHRFSFLSHQSWYDFLFWPLFQKKKN